MEPWRIGNPEDEGKLLRCAKCGGPLRIGQHVSFTADSGAWEHENERDCAREKERQDAQ